MSTMKHLKIPIPFHFILLPTVTRHLSEVLKVQRVFPLFLYIYLQYFSKAIATWAMYCLSTGITIAAVKIINLALHLMYDEAQIVSGNNFHKSDKNLKESSGLV